MWACAQTAAEAEDLVAQSHFIADGSCGLVQNMADTNGCLDSVQRFQVIAIFFVDAEKEIISYQPPQQALNKLQTPPAVRVMVTERQVLDNIKKP